MDFMITGFPRSGTTWMANLLTTDSSVCYHDPLYHTHYQDFEHLKKDPGSLMGISCTGIWRWKEWFNEQDCKKVILHRPFTEVQQELHKMGAPYLEDHLRDSLDDLDGTHCFYRDIFSWATASDLYYELTGKPLSKVRFDNLLGMNVQPNFSVANVDENVMQGLYSELLEMHSDL